MSFKTRMASLASYDKGTIELNDDLKHYAFSNIFEVCSKSKPYERVMVASNLEYAAEAVRAEGASPWYTAPHDEFATVMDGEIEFTFFQLDRRGKAHAQGRRDATEGRPQGQAHGTRDRASRSSGAAANGRRLPAQGGEAVGNLDPDLGRP